MKLGILIICILTTISSYGQETVLKKKKGELFYVLKDKQEIKHGTYQYSRKKRLIEKGQYDNGKKVGIWEFYDASGDLEQKYDYSLKQLIFNKEAKQFNDCLIVVNGTSTEIVPDTTPIFIGGQSRYFRYLEENLDYPADSKSKGIEGRQIVLIYLSNQGEILGTQIYRPISPDIDKEALRLINELPKEWIPAKHQNKNVDVIVRLPVQFTLK